MKLNENQASALADLLAMPVTGQGGWQTRMRRFHTAFGSSPNEGVSNDKRIIGAALNTRAAATTVKPIKATAAPANLSHDPISRIESLSAELAELTTNAEVSLTNQIERLRNLGTVAAPAKAAQTAAPAAVEAPKAKRKFNRKQSNAMKRSWTARKAAAAAEAAAKTRKGKR